MINLIFIKKINQGPVTANCISWGMGIEDQAVKRIVFVIKFFCIFVMLWVAA